MWKERAERGLFLFEASASDEGDRTWQIFNHILEESNSDEYISRDYPSVWQTAGGLPVGTSFDYFVAQIAGHVRSELESINFDESASDNDFKTAALTFDDAIRRHIRFLNGAVHQIAAGKFHISLWEYILRARDDSKSIYSCYRDYLVDA